MFKFKYFAQFICLTFLCNVNTSVLKRGKQAPITVDDMLTPGGLIFMKSSYFKWIFPGTKWCGDGDIAKDYDDLGAFAETDKCCREHDFCADILYSGEMKENITNVHKFTRLHCDCDVLFYTCLKNNTIDKISARIIGISYFDVLAPKCYAYQPPAVCTKYHSTFGFNKRCVQYKYDCTMISQWQWFDVPKWTTFI